jgi:iron transport multicopper oxidase
MNRYGSVDMGAANKATEQQRIAEMNQPESHELVSPATTVVEAPEAETDTKTETEIEMER